MLHLQFTHPLTGTPESIRVQTPLAIVRADSAAQVQDAIRTLQDWQSKGFWAAGYLAYEAASGLSAELAQLCKTPDPAWPLLYFWIFDEAQITHENSDDAHADFDLSSWQPSLTPPLTPKV